MRLSVRRDLIVFITLAMLGAAMASPPPVEAQSSGPTPLKVVLLGDSYSAGNGAGPYYGPKDCYRSHQNWASRHTRWLDTQGYAVTLVNRACSGAVTRDILNDRKMDERVLLLAGDTRAAALARARSECTSAYPDEEYYEFDAVEGPLGFDVLCTRYLRKQIDAVGEDADLVLFSAGGNDVDFATIVQQCFAVGYRDPGTCRSLVVAAGDELRAVENALGTIFSQLRSRMRDGAKVGLVAYPYLSTDVDYVLESRAGLPGGDRYEAAAEVRALGLTGDTHQRDAVNTFNQRTGSDLVTYIDGVKAHFAGREPDPRARRRNPDRWLNEFLADTVIKAEMYHYNPTGHSEIDKLLRTVTLVGDTRLPADGGDIDVALVVDTTGSMGPYIDEAKAFATDFIAQVNARTTSARFALVTYQDHPSHTGEPDDYPSQVEIGFTSDAAAVSEAVNGMTLGYGGDTPESVYSGLLEAIGLPWRPGVKKVVVQLGDAPAHDPEPVTGYTAADVIQAAFEVDPAEVYVVDTGWAGEGLASVAEETNGAVVPSASPSELSEAMIEAMDVALDKPYAWAGGPYTAFTGVPVTFDASGSFDPGGPIASYEWDVDGDGIYEATTTTPTYEHTYTSDFDGFMAVRVTSDRGTAALGSVRVHASIDADEVPTDEDNCPHDHNPGQEDEDGDGIGDVCDPDAGFPTEDREGVFETTSDSEPCPPGEVSAADFSDRNSIPEVHLANIDCASFHDIVQGFADGRYGPALWVRRDQMAAFIARTLDAAGVTLPASTTDRFTDVAAGSTHSGSIHRLAAADIVLGGPGSLPATEFGPGLRVRRDQMASFLIRAAEFATEQQLSSETRGFDDVPPGNAHFGTINAAAELGLTQGFADGTYRPNNTVRRDQMATFVIRTLTHLLDG